MHTMIITATFNLLGNDFRASVGFLGGLSRQQNNYTGIKLLLLIVNQFLLDISIPRLRSISVHQDDGTKNTLRAISTLYINSDTDRDKAAVFLVRTHFQSCKKGGCVITALSFQGLSLRPRGVSNNPQVLNLLISDF